MGRSQETFSKKEREKSRVRKRKDKEEKKAERKANTTKGKSLEEMMAYVDENGNISAVPPDPKKKEIAAEDIQISSPKHMIEEPGIREGKVTFFNESKGYGFIKDKITQEGVFVHINNLSGPIKENDKVTFEVEEGQKGLQAVRVQIVTA